MPTRAVESGSRVGWFVVMSMLWALVITIAQFLRRKQDWLRAGPDVDHHPDHWSATCEFADWRDRERQRKAMLERVNRLSSKRPTDKVWVTPIL